MIRSCYYTCCIYLTCVVFVFGGNCRCYTIFRPVGTKTAAAAAAAISSCSYAVRNSHNNIVPQNNCRLSSTSSRNDFDFLVTEEPTVDEKGLYRDFAHYAWNALLNDKDVIEKYGLAAVPIGNDLSYKETAAPGGPTNSTQTSNVRITIQAASSENVESASAIPVAKDRIIQYARFALIETIGQSSSSSSSNAVHTSGIQVLNLVIIPYKDTGLPVFGADFVSLPGNKHLLLLDAQPVRNNDNNNTLLSNIDDWFQEWYVRNQIQNHYVWGGDLPEQVQQYVSKYALWTRFGTSPSLQQSDKLQNVDPVQVIQGAIFKLFQDHFQTYLQMLDYYKTSLQDDVESPTLENEESHTSNSGSSRLMDYLQYRLDNDPARPMLKRLFGSEWTEQVLHDVLFPIHNMK